jgi:hypothetical protein
MVFLAPPENPESGSAGNSRGGEGGVRVFQPPGTGPPLVTGSGGTLSPMVTGSGPADPVPPWSQDPPIPFPPWSQDPPNPFPSWSDPPPSIWLFQDLPAAPCLPTGEEECLGAQLSLHRSLLSSVSPFLPLRFNIVD